MMKMISGGCRRLAVVEERTSIRHEMEWLRDAERNNPFLQKDVASPFPKVAAARMS